MELVEILQNPIVLLLAIPTLLISLNEMFKSMGMNNKYCPVINLIGGFLAMPFLMNLGLSWYVSIMGALMIGLSASGFYDIKTKTLIKTPTITSTGEDVDQK